MEPTLLDTALSNAATPLALVDATGIVQWRNRSMELLLPTLAPKSALSAAVPEWHPALPLTEPPLPIAGYPGLCASATPLGLPCTTPAWLVAITPRTAPTSESQTSFIAAAAHDLKNPLSAIFGFADSLLETNLGTGMPDRARGVISGIRNTAVRSIELIRNLQFLYRLQSSPNARAEVRCDLSAVANQVAELSSRTATTHHQESWQIPTTPLWVPLDRLECERVLSNLYLNARKFTPANGTITVQIRSVAASACNDRVELRVHNTGSFIPPEEIPLLLERGFRGRGAAEVTGSGLGLTIVQSILNVAGGTIRCTSSTETGTEFLVSLPRLKDAVS